MLSRATYRIGSLCRAANQLQTYVFLAGHVQAGEFFIHDKQLRSAARALAAPGVAGCPPLNSPANRDADSESRPTSSHQFQCPCRSLSLRSSNARFPGLSAILACRESGLSEVCSILKIMLHRRRAPPCSYVFLHFFQGASLSNISPESASQNRRQRAASDFPDPEPANIATSRTGCIHVNSFQRLHDNPLLDSMRCCTNLLLSL